MFSQQVGGRHSCPWCQYATDLLGQMSVHFTRSHGLDEVQTKTLLRKVREAHLKGITVSVAEATVNEAYPGEKQEWIDYLTEMKDAIGRGLCDTILRDIARAVFDRRDVLQGKSPGSSFGAMPKVSEVERLQKIEAVAQEVTQNIPASAPFVAVPLGMSAVHDHEGAFVGKIPQTQVKRGTPQFSYNGAVYDKSNLMGKTIRVPMTVNPSYIRNLRVRVVGIGTKKVKAEWVDMPKDGSSYRREADAGNPTWLNLDAIAHLLG